MFVYLGISWRIPVSQETGAVVKNARIHHRFQEGLAGIFGVPERYVDSITFKMLEVSYTPEMFHKRPPQKNRQSQNSGKDHLPTSPFFRGELLNFGGCTQKASHRKPSGLHQWPVDPGYLYIWDEILASYIVIMISHEIRIPRNQPGWLMECHVITVGCFDHSSNSLTLSLRSVSKVLETLVFVPSSQPTWGWKTTLYR